MLRSFFQHVAPMLPLLFLGACATMNVSADYDTRADFSQYETYAWKPDAGERAEDASIDDDPLLHSHIRTAVEEELASAGLQQRPTDLADVLIDYDVAIEKKRDVVTSGYDPHFWRHGFGYGFPDHDVYGHRTYVYDYKAGTIVVDLIDAGTRNVVWRGIVEAEIYVPMEEQERNDRVKQAVRQMFEEFPPPKEES